MQISLKDELHNVISGKSQVRFGTAIQAISSYLDDGAQASRSDSDQKRFKKQETEKLELYISRQSLWIDDIDFSQYVSEGAEQKVYLKDSEHVIKLNDAIYYTSWKDYFFNLLLHNYFFSDTAYELIGFTKENEVLYAVVKQPFVEITETTNLQQVRDFMTQNGFENNRNNDYRNVDLGIILEDLHDENVLTRNDVLYFIDTVFYLTENFWKKV
ncbi:XRE family transcriptional regulator [Flavobacterium longum]